MHYTIRDSQGSISIAVVVIIVAVMSGVSMASIAFRDSVSFRYQLDGLQQLHVLRSEVGRGRMIAGHFETMATPPPSTLLPERDVNVDFGNHRTVYTARTRLDIFDDNLTTGYYIRSLISAVRGEDRTVRPGQSSPVKRYGENKIRSLQTIALFHYFTDVDRYIDDRVGGIVFYGGDIIYGRVHSNSEIFINFSMAARWPTFYGLVSTGETIRVSGGGQYPRDEVFRGGLIENYPRIAFDPSADLVRRNGQRPLGANERDDAIAYVTVDGSSYQIMLGEIEVESDPPDEWIEGYNQFTIFDMYPPYGPVGREIGVNRIPRKDTVWSVAQTGSLANGSMFIPMQMWISGNFAGRQTWASSQDIYLKGDLTYRSTPIGQRPDGRDEEGNPVRAPNTTDFLGIISEESIYIQYGHWNPIDSVRVRPNTDDIYMYGAYCAVGQSDNAWEDGIFTFQYRRPKGSTPPQYWRGEYFKFIDLHLFHYPTTVMNPWPPGMDYPWYNPLWPEPGALVNVPGLPNWTPNPHNAPEVVEWRGIIYIFGSIAQRRRGAVGIPPGFMFDTGIWDIDNAIHPNDPPRYGTWAPGWVGYDKRYTTDLRFERTGPPDYPIVRFEGYESEELKDLGYLTLSWAFRNPPSNF